MRARLLPWALVLVAVLGGAAVERVAWARPDKPAFSELWKYGAEDLLETYPATGGHFLLHFVRKGPNAVPAADDDKDGLPDHVQSLADLLEKVLAFYQGLGFAAPLDDAKTPGNNGGDGRFDVYLLDFAKSADGHFSKEVCTGGKCSGYLVMENDFFGYGYPTIDYAHRVLASHEFFHAVQAAYDANQNNVISEGTAVWATEKYDASLSDFEGFVGGYLKHPDHSLDKPMIGAVDGFSYGSAIFFQFLDLHVGGQVVRQLWQDCADGAQGVADPQWLTALAALLKREHGTTFANQFESFALWNLLTGKYADPKRSYPNGAKLPLVATLAEELPYTDDQLRVFYASAQYLRFLPGSRQEVTAAVVPKGDVSSLRLFVVLREGLKLGEPVPLPVAPTGALQAIDVTKADEVFVAVVNVATGGESARGTLCVGDLTEVQACLPPPAPPPEDAGSLPDVAGAADAGAGDGSAELGQASEIAGGPDAAPSKPAVAEGGCAAVPFGSGPAGLWVFGALGALLAARRRSRR